jgi:hypothetical protein
MHCSEYRLPLMPPVASRQLRGAHIVGNPKVTTCSVFTDQVACLQEHFTTDDVRNRNLPISP